MYEYKVKFQEATKSEIILAMAEILDEYQIESIERKIWDIRISRLRQEVNEVWDAWKKSIVESGYFSLSTIALEKRYREKDKELADFLGCNH